MSSIRDTLQGIRYDLDEGSQCVDLSALEALIDDLAKLKAQCLEEPGRAVALVVVLCDSYGIVVAQ